MKQRISLTILGLSSSHSGSNSYALILGEENGNRRLPIIIGGFEAQAIALEIEHVKPNRPMTHDLFRNMAQEFNITIVEILISSLKEGVFFAQIVCEQEGEQKFIDARPSDAIAIGVRFNAPIYTYEDVMKEGGIILRGDGYVRADENETEKNIQSDLESTTANKEEDLEEKVQRLKTSMEEALMNEDYERAAKLRDEIKKLGF